MCNTNDNVAVSSTPLLQPKGDGDKLLKHILLELSYTNVKLKNFLSIHLKFKGYEMPKNLLV